MLSCFRLFAHTLAVKSIFTCTFSQVQLRAAVQHIRLFLASVSKATGLKSERLCLCWGETRVNKSVLTRVVYIVLLSIHFLLNSMNSFHSRGCQSTSVCESVYTVTFLIYICFHSSLFRSAQISFFPIPFFSATAFLSFSSVLFRFHLLNSTEKATFKF